MTPDPTFICNWDGQAEEGTPALVYTELGLRFCANHQEEYRAEIWNVYTEYKHPISWEKFWEAIDDA